MLMFANQGSVFNLCTVISCHFPVGLADKGFVCALHAPS